MLSQKKRDGQVNDSADVEVAPGNFFFNNSLKKKVTKREMDALSSSVYQCVDRVREWGCVHPL